MKTVDEDHSTIKGIIKQWLAIEPDGYGFISVWRNSIDGPRFFKRLVYRDLCEKICEKEFTYRIDYDTIALSKSIETY